MTCIIQYSDRTERWSEITSIVQVPGILKLYRGKTCVKDVTVHIRMEVI